LTPLQLFGLICIFAVVRVAMTIRRAPVSVPDINASATTTTTTAQPSTADTIREYLDAFIVAGLVALFLITFVVRTFYIPSGSMEPTLQIHDVLLVNEFEYRIAKPHDGDIIVFTPPIPSDNDFIKRLIAGPGEKLRIHQGIVYRNDVPLDERYIAERPAYELEIKNFGVYVDGTPLDPEVANIPPREMWQAPDRIPNGYYWMMGDNRNNSEDSHVWGFAQVDGNFTAGPIKGHKARFTGHAFFLFWPPNRLRILN